MDSDAGELRPGETGLTLVLSPSPEPAEVAATLERAEQVLARLGLPHQVLIAESVEDNYAGALRLANTQARYPLVAVAAADADVAALNYLVPLAKRFDVIWAPSPNRQTAPLRRFFERTYNLLTRLLLGTRVNACGGGSALTLVRRSRLKEVVPESRDYFAAAEVLARARVNNCTIVEVPVPTRTQPVVRRAGEVLRAAAQSCTYWWSQLRFGGPAPTSQRRSSWLLGVTLMILAALLLFPKLNGPLLDPDEGRQAEVAREMLAHDDLLLPRMAGVPYYAKPPLQYWLTRASYTAFGIKSSSARLVPATAAWLAVLVTFLWGRRALGARPAFLGGLALCLTPGFILLGRTVVLDSLLAFWVVASWSAAHTAVAGPVLRWRWWVVSALSCGLGILTKGPVALVLLVPPVLVYQMLTPSAARPRPKSWAVYGVLAVSVAAPWYVAMSLAHRGYLQEFLWHNNVARFTQPFDHEQPWWFYGPVLFAVTLPWPMLWPALGHLLFSHDRRLMALRTPGLGLCVLTAGWVLLFYSLSGCKSPPYLAPLFSPLALLLGACLEAMFFQRLALRDALFRQVRRVGARRVFLSVVTLSAMSTLIVAVLGWYDWPSALGVTIVSGALVIAWYFIGKQIRPILAWTACGAATFAFVLLIVQELVPAFAGRHTPRELARVLRHWHGSADRPVVFYERDWPSALFYLRRESVLYVEKPNESALVRFLSEQPEAFVLVESGPILDELVGALPANVEHEVHLPERTGQAALLVVRQRH